MLGVRIHAIGSRSMESESHKRARADDPAYGGGRTATKDFRAEKKMQQNHNLHQQQYNYRLPNLAQQQRSHHFPNPSASASTCSTSMAPQSSFLGAAVISGYSATRSPTTSDIVQYTRPTGVFDFPWQKERLTLDMEGWNFRDVFFSSLVDGCSARIGLPGDRLGCHAAPFTIRLEDFPLTLAGDHDDPDGADCIWSCALQQPLLATGGFSPALVGIGAGSIAAAAHTMV